MEDRSSGLTEPRQDIPTAGFRIDSAIWIAVASAFGYVAVYFYEMAFCHHFGIPEEFIQVSLLRLLYVPAIVLNLYIAANFIVQVLDRVPILRKLHPIPWLELIWSLWFLALGFFLWWAGVWWLLIPSVGFAFLICLDIFSPKRRWARVNRAATDSRIDTDYGPFEKGYLQFLGKKGLIAITMLYMAVFVADVLGRGVARHKKEFLYISTAESEKGLPDLAHVVLAKYGSNYVCVAVDSAETYCPNFHLIASDWIATRPNVVVGKVQLKALTKRTSAIPTQSPKVPGPQTDSTNIPRESESVRQ